MEYLQQHGIGGARLAFKGLGPTKPLATNDTPEGRALNRRTEFVITGR
jgi:outer membrane protein OmpA-like peptidoglycan-associated protein